MHTLEYVHVVLDTYIKKLAKESCTVCTYEFLLRKLCLKSLYSEDESGSHFVSTRDWLCMQSTRLAQSQLTLALIDSAMVWLNPQSTASLHLRDRELIEDDLTDKYSRLHSFLRLLSSPWPCLTLSCLFFLLFYLCLLFSAFHSPLPMCLSISFPFFLHHKLLSAKAQCA